MKQFVIAETVFKFGIDAETELDLSTTSHYTADTVKSFFRRYQEWEYESWKHYRRDDIFSVHIKTVERKRLRDEELIACKTCTA